MMADTELEDDTPAFEPEDIEEEAEEQEAAAAEEGEEDFSIEIEGETLEDETPLIKTLRQQNREQARELAEFRKAQMPKIELGPKPTLEGCEYDEERFEAELDAWKDRQQRIQTQEQQAQQQAEVRNREWETKLTNFRVRAAALPVKDFAQAEETLRSTLPEVLQSALLMYAEDPAKVGYALYKHPAKLAALSQETDPIRFVMQINALERNLKVTTRSKPPAPESETILRGSAPLSAGGDKELARLEKEAERTGDRSKLIQYKAARKAA